MIILELQAIGMVSLQPVRTTYRHRQHQQVLMLGPTVLKWAMVAVRTKTVLRLFRGMIQNLISVHTTASYFKSSVRLTSHELLCCHAWES